jgi:hypothetical protein
MAGGRKAINLEMQGNKSIRQRCWEAIRTQRTGITCYGVARVTGLHDGAVRGYVDVLLKGGYLAVEVVAKAFVRSQLRLIKDTGAEAPALLRDGSPSPVGLGQEAMWRTLRIIGEVNASELAAQASIAAPVTLWTAKTYLRRLCHAGYVRQVSAGKSGTAGYLPRYQMAAGKNTGPRPPMIQRSGQVYDANLGEVVFHKESEVDL